MRMIQDEAFRCKRITEKLLDFSRCGDIQRQRTDLVELVEGVVEMMRHMGKYREKRIVFQPREAVVALVDPQEIKQVVLNLVVNALDSMEPGGVLRIDARMAAGQAELTFRDDGCGMSAEVLENIFEPFYTRRKDGKGTGPRPVDLASDRQPARRRDRRHQPRRGARLDLHRPPADPAEPAPP